MHAIMLTSAKQSPNVICWCMMHSKIPQVAESFSVDTIPTRRFDPLSASAVIETSIVWESSERRLKHALLSCWCSFLSHVHNEHVRTTCKGRDISVTSCAVCLTKAPKTLAREMLKLVAQHSLSREGGLTFNSSTGLVIGNKWWTEPCLQQPFLSFGLCCWQNIRLKKNRPWEQFQPLQSVASTC